MHQNFRPVTLVGMEQLAERTFNLIRGNFLKRLAEVFFNLKQQLLQAPSTFRKDEFWYMNSFT